jgi:hypothetical protein
MDSSEYKCEYCSTIMKTKSNLTNHLKTAKYCLKLRNEINEKFICKFCKNNFSSNYGLQNHINICNKKLEINLTDYELRIKEQKRDYELKLKDQKQEYELKLKEQEEKYENKIKELQLQIERLATVAINRPTTSVQNNNHQRINQVVNNLLPISDDHLKEQAQYLTIDHIKNGVIGYTQYALDYPLKDRIICTDFSRKKIKYKDENGIIVDDPEMVKLSQKLFKAIEEKNDILINEYMKELHDKHNILIMEPNDEMNDYESNLYQKKLEIIFNELFKIKTQKREITEVANGNKNNIYNEFVKDICSKTT